jgi:predicted metalloendopeptidase
MHKPPPSDAFGSRGRALEEAFFKDRDQKLLNKLRNELQHFEESKKLAHVSGIVEQQVLTNLVEAGITAETLVAVGLIPLIEVAWSDGAVSREEKEAVLNAAAAEGIQPDTAARHMLEQWLTSRPDSRVVAAWKEYVSEMARLMPAETTAAIKKQMIDRATRVAEAAGGFLGLATISKVERATIDDFARHFDA